MKRRQNPGAAEGVVTVRNLLGAMVTENALRGIVVSTADHFTYRAYEAVGRVRERGLTVDLIDRGKLDRVLDPLLPKHPWEHVVDPGLRRYFRKHLGTAHAPGVDEPKRQKKRNKKSNRQPRLFPEDVS